MADLEALHESSSLSGIRHIYARTHRGAALGRLCALRLVTLLEHLPQLLLAPAKVFYLVLDSGLFGSAAVRRGESAPGPFPTYVSQGLVGDMRLRVCGVVKNGIAIDDNILQNHRGLVLRSSILGERFLGLELGIEMTSLTLKAQPGTFSVIYTWARKT